MAISLEQFVDHLIDCGLFSDAAVQTILDVLPGDRKPESAEELARELVRQKRLTSFQAKRVYCGEGSSLVLGNYVLLDMLGQGGMGMVFKAKHRRMERLVALKILSPAITCC